MNVKDGIEIPENVFVEAEIAKAKETLYRFGVKPEEYEDYFGHQYQLDAIQEGQERETKSNNTHNEV